MLAALSIKSQAITNIKIMCRLLNGEQEDRFKLVEILQQSMMSLKYEIHHKQKPNMQLRFFFLLFPRNCVNDSRVFFLPTIRTTKAK